MNATYKSHITIFFLLISLLSINTNSLAEDNDKHYSPVGFFDIHVCHWPNRPLFLLTLFSTTHYQDIESIQVYAPDDRLLTIIGMERYRIIKDNKHADKRVFMKQVELSKKPLNGWYKTLVTLKNGVVDETRDYVIIKRMDKPKDLQPAHGTELTAPVSHLSWSAVDGALYYQVFIRDLWDEERLIFTSDLLDKPYAELPFGLIQADGWYEWKVHARDVNEDPLLGDFNHGSLSSVHQFTTANQ
ncbi:MAG: hypothetical protein GXP22_02140 [Gammaproteobacteria bacterium]|nr:hypothetical protein [Gammaproteobacteria bacterium]